MASQIPDMDTTSSVYDNYVAVADGIFWLGYYDKNSDLTCNPYLLVDHDEVVLFDPGSIPHFPLVMRKIIDLINPETISKIVVHHQDPDVCGNIAVVEELINRSDLRIVTHSKNVRFLEHLGIRSICYEVDKNDHKLTLKSGRVLEFIHTPYLHSPFAMVTYDPETKSLFSSDIFGALTREWTLFAAGDFLPAIGRWHQIIIPTNLLLRPCMERFERMDILRILPQHGSVLERENVWKAIEYLKTLPCGIDC